MTRVRYASELLPAPEESCCSSMREIGRVIRLRRKELGYTQGDVAEFLGYSPRLIGEIENGRETVAINKVMRYAHGMGIDFILKVRRGT